MNKEKAGKRILYFVTALVALLFCAYIIYHFVLSFSSSVESELALYITKDETITAQGYIFKNETLIRSASSGIANYSVINGEKVKKDGIIASIYSGTDDKSIEKKLDELDAKIDILTQSTKTLSYGFFDTSSLDAEIYEVYYLICQQMSRGEIQLANQKLEDLLVILNKRNLVIDSSMDFSAQIQFLRGEKSKLLLQYSNSGETITATKSGSFYVDADGYEDLFTADTALSMSYADFQELKTSLPSSNEGGRIRGKIASDFKWYLATEIPKAEMRFFEEGGIYRVNFPYNAETELDMLLERVVLNSDGESVVLVFSSLSSPAEFSFVRSQTVEIVKTEYSGYRVPSSAVRVLDGTMGVYIQKGYVVCFRRIVPLAEFDGYYIVKEDPNDDYDGEYEDLALYDAIITKGKYLYHGKVID
ncbi:MAG: hypothetical protein J5922_01420 [Clostridia bacterium]|nr:hypothetical protein [Clostridia bacterium]